MNTILSEFKTWKEKSLQEISSPKKQRDALKWFVETLSQSPKKNNDVQQYISESGDGTRGKAWPGTLCTFAYSAKWKDILPYWDKFPLALIIEIYRDGFLGLNLHYISPRARFALLAKLMEISHSPKWSPKTKLKVSYAILKKAEKSGLFTPCIKRYLASHIRSTVHFIHPKDWDMAINLPSEQFVGLKKQDVWKRSLGARY